MELVAKRGTIFHHFTEAYQMKLRFHTWRIKFYGHSGSVFLRKSPNKKRMLPESSIRLIFMGHFSCFSSGKLEVDFPVKLVSF